MPVSGTPHCRCYTASAHPGGNRTHRWGPGWGQRGDSGGFGGAEAERSSWRARGTEAGGDAEQSRRAGHGQPVLTRRACGEAGTEEREREQPERGGPALEAERGALPQGTGRARAGRAEAARPRQAQDGQDGAGSAELLWAGRVRHGGQEGTRRARQRGTQPWHSHGTATAWPRHSRSMGKAQPRHSHGTATAWPQHGHGTAAAWARHSLVLAAQRTQSRHTGCGA